MKNKLVERSASMFHTERFYKFANIQWMIYSSTLHYGEREGNALYWKWDIKTYIQCKSLEEWVIPSYKTVSVFCID